MAKESVDKSNKEWVISSTKEGRPKSLSEIAILTDDDYFMLDQLIGRDFAVDKPRLPFEGDHFIDTLQTIVLKSVDDIIVLFHEIGHAVIQTEKSDVLSEKVPRKIEGKIRAREDIHDLNKKEIEELIRIRAERMASAYALRKIREIRRERGVDLLNGKSFEEIKAKIDYGLSSYFHKIRDTKEYKEKLKALTNRLGITAK